MSKFIGKLSAMLKASGHKQSPSHSPTETLIFLLLHSDEDEEGTLSGSKNMVHEEVQSFNISSKLV